MLRYPFHFLFLFPLSPLLSLSFADSDTFRDLIQKRTEFDFSLDTTETTGWQSFMLFTMYFICQREIVLPCIDARGWCELNLTLILTLCGVTKGKAGKCHDLDGHDGHDGHEAKFICYRRGIGTNGRPYLSYRPIPYSVVSIRTIP